MAQQTKALEGAANEAARAFAKEILDTRFEGVVRQAARGLGVSQSYLHEFLAGNRGAGPRMLNALAAFRGSKIDVVMGRSAEIPLPAAAASAIENMRFSACTREQLLAFSRHHAVAHLNPNDWVRLAKAYEEASAIAGEVAALRTPVNQLNVVAFAVANPVAPKALPSPPALAVPSLPAPPSLAAKGVSGGMTPTGKSVRVDVTPLLESASERIEGNQRRPENTVTEVPEVPEKGPKKKKPR